VVEAFLDTPEEAQAAGIEVRLWDPATQLRHRAKRRTLPRPDGNCTLSNVARSSDRATYELACTNDSLTTQGKADIRFGGDRYDGKVDLTVTEKSGNSAPLIMTIAAKRISDCSK